MIKLFRNIRKSLLSEGKTSKYFKYAIGEIVLVVIGILIALQINNWNDLRKEHASEHRLLEALNEEFRSNLEILEQTISFNDSIIAKSLELGEFTAPELEHFDEKAISKLMVRVFKDDIKYIPNQGSIDDIFYSGKLSILRDTNLRKALSTWQSSLEGVKNQEKYVLDRRDIAHRYFLDNGNFRRHLNLMGLQSAGVTPSKFPNNSFNFLEQQSFESNLYLFIVASINLNENYYARLKQDIELIIDNTKKGMDK